LILGETRIGINKNRYLKKGNKKKQMQVETSQEPLKTETRLSPGETPGIKLFEAFFKTLRSEI
jgi:hypothetical protein